MNPTKELSFTISIRDVRVARSQNEILQPNSLRGHGSTQGHRIKIGGLGRMANPAFRENPGFCGTFSHISTIFVVALVIVNKYNVYVQ